MSERADIVVIGMGPGGEDVAGKLAEAGLDVIGIDEALVGGECPYWGCVPSKMMIRAANLLAEARRIPGMAGASTVLPDWEVVARRIRDEATDDWDDRVAVERFEKKGGRFVRGHARMTGPRTVEVGDRTFEAQRGIVIAAGTKPFIPPLPGLDKVDYWTNHQAIETETVPRSLIVLGGGAIGAELSQVFARFGAQVTVVEHMDRLLALEEPEAGELIGQAFEREGIAVRTSTKATGAARDGEAITLELEDGSTLTAERLLVAVGRRADLGALNVAAAGIDDTGRGIPVDARMRAADGVWAMGDVTQLGPFTHVSMYHAAIVVADILGKPTHEATYHALPRVTFTDPEVGSVGLSERAARERGLDVRTGFSQIPSSARGWIHKAGNDGFIKLVEDADRGVLVGATSVGPCGGEVLSMLTLAVHAAVPIDSLRAMIYAYPTFHRAVEDALRDLVSKG